MFINRNVAESRSTLIFIRLMWLMLLSSLFADLLFLLRSSTLNINNINFDNVIGVPFYVAFIHMIQYLYWQKKMRFNSSECVVWVNFFLKTNEWCEREKNEFPIFRFAPSKYAWRNGILEMVQMLHMCVECALWSVQCSVLGHESSVKKSSWTLWCVFLYFWFMRKLLSSPKIVISQNGKNGNSNQRINCKNERQKIKKTNFVCIFLNNMMIRCYFLPKMSDMCRTIKIRSGTGTTNNRKTNYMPKINQRGQK